jgi:hypothetical protein
LLIKFVPDTNLSHTDRRAEEEEEEEQARISYDKRQTVTTLLRLDIKAAKQNNAVTRKKCVRH